MTALTGAVRFTNLDKVLYAEQGITKAALVAYYALVADRMLPHVADRPLTLVRCPNGPTRGCFYQKHARVGVPPAVRRVAIHEERGEEDEYLAIKDRDGLLALAQYGALELHTWGSHVRSVERPDVIVFDLDPDPSVRWSTVVEAAVGLRRFLADLDLETFVKTTGGKGLHVVVPVAPRLDWEAVKEFTRLASEAYARRAPAHFTTNPLKVTRKGKIFIDYLRNARGATAVAPYSTRARPGAPVATPVSWEELERGIDPAAFDLTTVPERLRSERRDPWGNFAKTKQSISLSVRKELERRSHGR